MSKDTNWYENFLHEAELIKPHDLKKYECSCPVEVNGSQELFFCKYLVTMDRQELMYKSGEGYTKQWVERSLCFHKWAKERGISPDSKKSLDRITGEEGGIEDNYGEGGLGL